MDLSKLVNELRDDGNKIRLLQKMMELDTIQDMVKFQKTLPEDQRLASLTLMQLVVMEMQEERIAEMESFPEVENLLKKISKSG